MIAAACKGSVYSGYITVGFMSRSVRPQIRPHPAKCLHPQSVPAKMLCAALIEYCVALFFYNVRAGHKCSQSVQQWIQRRMEEAYGVFWKRLVWQAEPVHVSQKNNRD